MQSRSSPARGDNGVIRHLLGAVGNTPLQKGSLELSLIVGISGLFENSFVCQAGYVVGFAKHGDLEFILDDTGNLNSLLEGGKVLVLELDKGDVVGNLAVNGIDGRFGVTVGEVSQCGVDLGGELDLVDIVQLQHVVDGDGKAGPDDIFGINGRNEEGRLGGLDVVGVVAVCEVAAGEVVEESALSVREAVSVGMYRKWGETNGQYMIVPEMLRRVIVL